uniref:Beta-lactamase n=1 Tax=Magnetococcus massalia (strain MO-1) TaxID=451514 RepID=A0A1S7LIC5_MAGMO|nr:putative D class Beta-lactamase [Candidatus Magnetococcus massalia]
MISFQSMGRFGAFLCLLMGAILFYTPHSRAADLQQDPALAQLFSKAGVNGTLVLQRLDGSQRSIHNPQRAQTRFLPASTFKILNTLIALERGVAKPHMIFKWDGVVRSYKVWNQDLTLSQAFNISCVWCYQQLAQQIGVVGYRAAFAGLSYGTEAPGPELTNFWLEGDLAISALEQIHFLKQLVKQQLPFSPASYTTLKQMMGHDLGQGAILYAKTGWAARVKPQIGWYVGYLQRAGEHWLFALNMEITQPKQLKLRKQLVMDALRLKGLLPPLVQISHEG